MRLLHYFSICLILLSASSACDKILNDEEEPETPEKPDGPQKDDNIQSGLSAYFTFDGNFEDTSGNGVYGYGAPEPSFTTGVTPGSKALSFTKKNKETFVVADGLIDSRSMTISFWAKGISEGNIFHVTSSDNDDGGVVMMSFTYRSGHLKYVISRYNNYYNFNRTGNFTHKSIEDGEWHHIALVSDYNGINYSAATSSLYIDGHLMDTQVEDINVYGESEHPHYGTGTKFILGGENVPNMQIANLRVYDSKQLSTKAINKIYNAKF